MVELRIGVLSVHVFTFCGDVIVSSCSAARKIEDMSKAFESLTPVSSVQSIGCGELMSPVKLLVSSK